VIQKCDKRRTKEVLTTSVAGKVRLAIADHRGFPFVFQQMLNNRGGHILGLALSSSELFKTHHAIFLHPKWMEYLTMPWGIARATDCEKVRFQVYTAIVLCHEVAHIVAYNVFPGLQEPYHMEDAPNNELGESWENAVLGGLIIPAKLPAGVFVMKEWGTKEKESREPVAEWPVPLEWMSSLVRGEATETSRMNLPEFKLKFITQKLSLCRTSFCGFSDGRPA